MTSGGEWLRDEDFTEMAGRVADVTQAGLPLESGLRALAEEAPSRRLRRALRQLSRRLDAGEPFETVFAAEGRGLPTHLRRMILAGLQTGRLGLLMEEYVEHAHRRADHRWQIVTTFAYPLLLILLTIGIVGFLMTWIVPEFKDIFEDFGMELPGITILLIEVSDVMRAYGQGHWILWELLSLGIGLWLIIILYRRLFGVVPIIGGLFRSAALAGLCRILAMLVENGVPLPEALRLAGQGTDDTNLQHACDHLADELQRGVPLDVAAAGRREFPPSLQHVFRWSNRQKAFPDALRAAADIFDSQTYIQAQTMALMCEPVLLIVVASSVGFIVVALFMPLIKLLNNLS